MKDILSTIITATVTTTPTERFVELAATASEAVKAVEDVVTGLYSTHEVESGAWAKELERAITPLKAALAAATPVETGDDFRPAEEHGRFDDATFDRVLEQTESDTTATPIGAWLEAAREAEYDEAQAASEEEERELFLRKVFSGPSPAMRTAAIAASVDPRELAEAIMSSSSACADGAGLVKAASVAFTDALSGIRGLADEYAQPSDDLNAIAAGEAKMAEVIMAAFNAATDAVGAIGVALAGAIPAIAPDLTTSGFIKDPEKFVQPLVDVRQRLLAAREVSRALRSTDEVLPGYLVPHLGTHCGEDAAGSVFISPDSSRGYEPLASGELARQMLGELEYAPLTPDPAWAMPGCRYYTGISRLPGSGILGRVGVTSLANLKDEDEVTLAPVHGDPSRLEVHYLDLEGTAGALTDHVTVVVGPEQGKEVVYTAFPGDPTAPSTLEASEFPEREMTAGELRRRLGDDRAAKVTVKLV